VAILICTQSMRSHSIYKVPEGKLLKISLDYDDKEQVIKDIRITGDFFAYPEEAIELLETRLRNVRLNRDVLYRTISSIITKYHIQFIGLNAEGLAQGILMCVP
jgi:lipoate-protein ligase A